MNFQQYDSEKKQRIVQELVPGKQITLAHIIANPDGELYEKLGLDPKVELNRAAIGISELADAVVVVVSEETGSISYTYGGHIYRHLDGNALRNVLKTFLNRTPQGLANIFKWRP